jgi:prophage antirepressor-like protein
MIKEDIFKVRAYGFGELAQLYFTSITKKSASAQLRRWITSSETVLPMLKNLGYKPGNRLLTPAHVKVIIEEFGEP